MAMLKPKQMQDALHNCIVFKLSIKGLQKTENQTWGEALKLAFHEVPQFKMIEQAQYLVSDLLPRIEKQKGNQAHEYLMLVGIVETIIGSIQILNKFDSLNYKLCNEKMLNEFYRNKVVFYENELQNYTTIEKLIQKETVAEIIKYQTTKN
jgi:hypothetical protein